MKISVGLNRRGSVLIIALWSLCLLATFVVYAASIVRQKLNLVGRFESRDSLHFIGEAGIDTAILELKKKDQQDNYYALNEAWSNNPSMFDKSPAGIGTFTISYNYGEGNSQEIRYGILDESSKININLAEAKVLTRLLENAAGLNTQRALNLAYCIIDWRDADSFFQHPQYGAEDANYRMLNEPYEAKDADFEVIEELLLIYGIDQEIYDKIKDFVTVYGSGKININTAPRQVFLALGLNSRLVTKILDFRKGGDLIAGSFDDNVFTNTGGVIPEMSRGDGLSSSEIGELGEFIAAEVFVTNSSDFMVKCLASLNTKKQTSEIEVVINSEGLIRRWKEDY